jgi:hypothetical protein
MKVLTFWRVVAAVLVGAFTHAPPARGADDAQADAAREVFKKHQDAVVWVSAVIKMRGGGPMAAMGQQEQKVDAVGTIIHESGLTVVSHSNIDPTSLMNSMFAERGGSGQEGKIEFKSELSGVRIRLADGSEIPAKLVMTDEDLDLAFILPTANGAKGKKLPFVKLTAEAAEAPRELAVMDPVTVLGRLDQTLDRQPAVFPTRVNAVVKKPRTFYVCNDLQVLGTPAFDATGRAVGIAVMRKQNLGRGLGSMLSSATSGGVAVVIIPGQDVMEVADQAMAKKDDAEEEPAPPPPAKPKAAPKAGAGRNPRSNPPTGKAPQ